MGVEFLCDCVNCDNTKKTEYSSLIYGGGRDDFYNLDGDSLSIGELETLHAKCAKTQESHKITLRFPSVGATENILIYSAFSGKKIELYNAAREPEIVDLQSYLNTIGANIYGAGTSKIQIYPVSNLLTGTDLSSKECHHTIISDRIECGTYLLAAAICGGKVLLKN